MGGGASLSAALDDFFDQNDRFTTFVMMSFDDEADSSQRLPRERALAALRSVYDLLAAILPAAGRRIITRAPEAEDVEAELPAGSGEGPLDFDTYEELARSVFRRIAVDRGRRLLTGVLVGTAVVAALKAGLRRTPIVGKLLHALLVPLLPTTLVAGPAAGLLICAYAPQDALTGKWALAEHGGPKKRRKRRPGSAASSH